MSSNSIQPDFSAGELSPQLFARVDLKQYHLGAAKMLNFFVDFRSGASTRPGTKYIANSADQTVGGQRARLFPFQVTDVQGYVLEFTNLALNIYKNGVLLAGASASPITTPYVTADLFTLKFAQRANTLIITHVNYPAKILTYTSDTVWSLANITYGATLPTVPFAGETTGLGTYPANNGLPGSQSNLQMAFVVVGTRALATVQFNYIVCAVDANGQEGPGRPIIGSLATSGDIVGITIYLNWYAIPGAVAYNVYKAPPQYYATGIAGTTQGFGFLASVNQPSPVNTVPATATLVSYTDTYPQTPNTQIGTDPNYAETPPIIVTDPFNGTGNPAVCAFYDQRLWFGATGAPGSPTGSPQTVWASQPGAYTGSFFNFNYSNPIQEDDAITATLVSKELSTIKHFTPMSDGLLTFSAHGAWKITGGAALAAITPVNIAAKPQAYNGASDLIPIVIEYDVLYGQAKQSIVRDIAYSFYQANYFGEDICWQSNQLFFGAKLTDWDYAEEPFKIVWVVRNDGAMLSLTFVKTMGIVGWAAHNTQGLFQAVAVVTETAPDGTLVDAVYVEVWRSGASPPARYIERLMERTFPTISDCWCLDAAKLYVGAPITVVTGLGHLNGMLVNALADGVVYNSLTVSGGSVTIPGPAASKILVGLAFTCQLQTIPLDLGNPTVQAKLKKIPRMTMQLKEASRLEVGRTFSNMVFMNEFSPPTLWPTNSLFTGTIPVTLDSLWDVPGQVCIRQAQPYPATVLGVTLEDEIGSDWEK